MEEDKTTVVDTKTIINENIKKELICISEDLEEIGYEPVKQIVAYLISGDPGYISSHKECRTRITKFQREEILELMLTNFIKE
jgi:uncharacterized protein (UPF0297 family)